MHTHACTCTQTVTYTIWREKEESRKSYYGYTSAPCDPSFNTMAKITFKGENGQFYICSSKETQWVLARISKLNFWNIYYHARYKKGSVTSYKLHLDILKLKYWWCSDIKW